MDGSLIDKALEIIEVTHDGNDLSPPHLKLTELAVNGFLNEEGKLAFEELYRNATKPGGYTVPWFHDIEHLTRDHQGYVRWKGNRVETLRVAVVLFRGGSRCGGKSGTALPATGIEGSSADCYERDLALAYRRRARPGRLGKRRWKVKLNVMPGKTTCIGGSPQPRCWGA
jgi:hypothetical protein